MIDRIEGSQVNPKTGEVDKVDKAVQIPRQAQKFLAAHDQINTVFRPRRYELSTISYRYAHSDGVDASYGLEKCQGSVMMAATGRRPWTKLA